MSLPELSARMSCLVAIKGNSSIGRETEASAGTHDRHVAFRLVEGRYIDWRL
jgi:hypothetical protein